MGLVDLTLLMDHGRISPFTLGLIQAPLQWDLQNLSIGNVGISEAWV